MKTPKTNIRQGPTYAKNIHYWHNDAQKYTIVIFQSAAILENSIDNLLEFWLLSNKYFPPTV
jgi:hypothetical protein